MNSTEVTHPHVDDAAPTPEGNRAQGRPAASTATAPTLAQKLLSPQVFCPAMLAVAAFLLYGTLARLQWDSMFFPSWDLGIFSEAVKAYAHFQAPIVPIKGDDYNLLGDHFHPLLIVLAPLWWIWPSAYMLLWAQAAMFAVSVYPLTRFAMRNLGPRLGFVAGLSYAFCFGLQGGQNVQFHEYSLGVVLFAFGIPALVERRIPAALGWIGALVFVKEDLGLTVMVLGLVAAWLWRTDELEKFTDLRRFSTWRLLNRKGLYLAAWGVAWFLLATFVILPHFNPDGSYAYTKNIGSVSSVIGSWDKWQTALMFIAFMGIAGLTSPIALALLPTFAWRYTGNVPTYWTWHWHYNTILMPIAFAALVLGVAKISGKLLAGYQDLRNKHTDRNKAALWTKRAAVALSLLSTAYLGTALPLTWIATGAFHTGTIYTAAAQQAIDAVPEGATVATDIQLMAPLVDKANVQWMDGPNKKAPQCIAAVYSANEYQQHPEGWANWANAKWPEAAAESPYALILANGYYQVACRGAKQ